MITNQNMVAWSADATQRKNIVDWATTAGIGERRKMTGAPVLLSGL